jgi:hypothetical protein
VDDNIHPGAGCLPLGRPLIKLKRLLKRRFFGVCPQGPLEKLGNRCEPNGSHRSIPLIWRGAFAIFKTATRRWRDALRFVKSINPPLFILRGDDYCRFSCYGALGLADSTANTEILIYIGTFYHSFRPVEMDDLFFS